MQSNQIIDEIKSLSGQELENLLVKLFSDADIKDQLERLGYLSLTEKAFEFWNDPKEDIYQDYQNSRSK